MGYTTDFDGAFEITPRLNEKEVSFIQALNQTRRVKRDVEKIKAIFPDFDSSITNGLGVDGEFFTGGKGDFGQGSDDSILEYNQPPRSQPGLWCGWTVEEGENTTVLVWDGGEKFYNYIEWLEYLIQKIFIPWGKTLNGKMYWRGEEFTDIGTINIVNNFVGSTTGEFV